MTRALRPTPRLALPVLALPALAAACSSSPGGGDDGSIDAGYVAADATWAVDAGTDAEPDGAGDAAPPTVFGGKRPVTLRVPAGYDPAKPAPLVILLHGYGASGLVEDIAVTHLADEADAAGYLLARPDGTVDASGSRFWNATDGCCNFDGSPVDDVAYLTGLVKDVSAAYSVDPKRVFFVGHSNGGFMAHRLACDAADVVAGIVSLAGATWKDQTKCRPSRPVAVLEVHGDKDDSVLYDGYPGGAGTGNGAYPGAVETVTDWAKLNGCATPGTTTTGALDLVAPLPGNETDALAFGGCRAGGDVALWTIHGAGHVPEFGSGFGKAIWTEWLAKHARP